MEQTSKILVLDDHKEMAEAVAELLEFEGHSPKVVHNAQDAIIAFREDRFDLGFFDIRMPGKNGVEAFLEIISEFPNAKIIMMSGFADEDLIEKALDAGALGPLTKPFDPEHLLGMI